MEPGSFKQDLIRNKEMSVVELLVQTSKVISSETDLQKLVQRITDLGTELTGASFGAFFYNEENDTGEKYLLYTISGVPREMFSKFPMPRNTAIFNPTFVGAGTVRYDDVTAQPHFGKNPPYHGMPAGHLPVRSYLATSVVSSLTGEVFGGLFFGHPQVGIFTAESEKLIEGIAAQAAIAMANARLLQEKKATEKMLLNQIAVFNTISNNTLHGLFLLDENHRCTYLNPAAEMMIGYRLPELKERPLHDYIHRMHADGRPYRIEDSPLDQALYTRTQMKGEDFFTHRDGFQFPVAFTASPILEDGSMKGAVVEVRNILEEKKAAERLLIREAQAKEELEHKVRERTIELEKTNYQLLQFTSVASHDLKEPLRKISIFSKLLREQIFDNLTPPQGRYLENIVGSASRMTKLIDDLLIYSRLSQEQPEHEPVNLNELLDQIVSDLEITIAEKKAVIQYQNLPTVMGVRLQLGQVFQNLISNSIKFAHLEKIPRITIDADSIGREGRLYHRLVYADNGIGFSNEHAEKIFQIFQRLHTKDQYEGTGIGLAIVKKIITAHQGEVKASGRPAQGAQFEILLPATAP
jgi:PAS domain S-box-containing protein